MIAKLKPEVKNIWIEGLASGEFEQGQSRLTTVGEDGKETDCCLGVLCKLAVRNGVKLNVETLGAIEDGGEIIEPAMKQYDGEQFALPLAVTRWAFQPIDGLDEDTNMDPVAGEYKLSSYNDGNDGHDIAPHSFPQIIELIREHL